jgi:Cu-Zn family superoxide dismutase
LTPDVTNAAFHFFLEDMTMNISSWIALTMTTLVFTGVARADDISVQMNAVNDAGVAELLGVVVISEATHGLEFTPELSGLTPGAHGFHVHESPSCEPAEDEAGKVAAAMAAGGHYDPETNNQHGSPLNAEGHKGDLPVLIADDSGDASIPVQAARLGVEDIAGRTLMIHVGGDNYSDTPEPLGGGGARFACGLIRP